jgi:hypothetical protein
MDRTAMEKLNLTPKTETELHAVYDNFLRKWENKVKRTTDRISRS